MKIKMETEEFVEWCGLWQTALGGVLDLLKEDMKRSKNKAPRIIQTVETKPFAATWEDEESSEEESAEEESVEDESVEEESADSDEFQSTEEGNAFQDLMVMWLQNFDSEGEQPDRGEYLRSSSTSKKGVLLHSYLQKESRLGKGKGLTTSVYDWLLDAIDSGEEPAVSAWAVAEGKGNTVEQFARQIAENITQVSSVVFYQISDFLEYPNPLEN
jgi:hypothetical protein